ncbi:MAG: CxxC-x17-CxxC domain-containing protein [Nitrososphaerota archaeon]
MSFGRGSRFNRSSGGSRFNRGPRFNRDDRPREMYKATCGDCGNECEIPFEPKDNRPVYCRECFQNHKPQERGGSRFNRSSGGSRFSRNDRGSRFNSGSRFNRGPRFNRDDRPREMYKATCGDCGNECEIPFEPKDNRPVYCRECFQNHR